MNRVVVIDRCSSKLPVDWWRWATIALAVTVLCSCSTVTNPGRFDSASRSRIAPRHRETERRGNARGIQGVPAGQNVRRSPGLPTQTTKLAPVVVPDYSHDAGEMEWFSGESMVIEDTEPQSTVVNCPSPESLAATPRDEYLCDGGDGLYRGSVDAVDQRGIEPSDTIAQFDNEFGRGHVVASNRVCIYAPRFASTRKITRAREEEVITRVGGLHERTRAAAEALPATPSDVAIDLGLQGQVSEALNHELQDAARGLLLDDVDVVAEASRRMIPFESRRVVETIQLDAEQRLASERVVVEAVQWTNIESVELAIDGRSAYSITNVGPPSSVYTYEVNRGDPRFTFGEVDFEQCRGTW